MQPQILKRQQRPELKKEISKIGFFCLAFGAMIGVGWVTAMGPGCERPGQWVPRLLSPLGGILMLFIGFCYAEVTAMLPVSGGEVAYAYKAFGKSHSFLVGWFLILWLFVRFSFRSYLRGKILSYLFPSIDRWPLYTINGDTIFGTHLLLALVCVAIITYVNYVGVQNSMRFQIYLTVIFLVIVVTSLSLGFR